MGNVLGHGLIDYLVVLCLLVYAVYAGFTKPHRILYILPACLSFFFFIEVGPRLTPDKLVPAVFLVATILHKGLGYYLNVVKNQSWIILVLLVVIFSAITGSFYTNYYASYVKSSFVNTRLIIQLISYLNYIFIFIIVRKECTLLLGSRRLLKAFLTTTTILCVYGVYQYYANQFGWPYRGIVYSASKAGFGGFSSQEELIFRVNSLANEPKRLTYFLVISSIIIIKYFKQLKTRVGATLSGGLLFLHLLVLWWTYSTSIYFGLAVFLFLLLFHSLFIRFSSKFIRFFIVASFLGVVAFVSQKDYLDNLYEVRVQEQLENEDVRSEVYGQQFFLNNPGLFILGLGPGIYNLALAKEYPGKAGIVGNGTFLVPFNSDLLIFLYDFGIVGFFIIFIPFFNIVLERQSSENRFAIYVVFMYCVAIVLSGTATLFFLLGAFEGEKNKSV